MGKGILILIGYHLLLFRHVYFVNPYHYARSEALEQGFASSRLLGRVLRSGGVLEDRFYYPDYAALPFLSSYYPPHRLQAWIGSFFEEDGAWLIYSTMMVTHFLLTSICTYALLLQMDCGIMGSLFGAVTLSSLGYALKQNSCIVYTAAWIPLYLLMASMHHTLLCGISLGIMLLAGYWPIALYTVPLGCGIWLLSS